MSPNADARTGLFTKANANNTNNTAALTAACPRLAAARKGLSDSWSSSPPPTSSLPPKLTFSSTKAKRRNVPPRTLGKVESCASLHPWKSQTNVKGSAAFIRITHGAHRLRLRFDAKIGMNDAPFATFLGAFLNFVGAAGRFWTEKASRGE